VFASQQDSIYWVRQANFLFYMAFHIQKRKLACRTLYVLSEYVTAAGKRFAKSLVTA
jgi:hypothetical protein